MKATITVAQPYVYLDEDALILRTETGNSFHRRIEFTGPAVLVQSSVPDRYGVRVWIECDTDDLILG